MMGMVGWVVGECGCGAVELGEDGVDVGGVEGVADSELSGFVAVLLKGCGEGGEGVAVA